MEISEEEFKKVKKMFPDLPNPKMYPMSFDYCVKVYQTLISIDNNWKNYDGTKKLFESNP